MREFASGALWVSGLLIFFVSITLLLLHSDRATLVLVVGALMNVTGAALSKER